MIKYLAEESELKKIINLLYRLFDMRITLMDMEQDEVTAFDIKEMSPYCLELRKNKNFDYKCSECDKVNYKIAKDKEDIHIYQCHNSLTEGIIPLYNKNRKYLGSIFFGQFIIGDYKEDKYSNKKIAELYKKVPRYSKKQTDDIALLLKYLGEYIISNELLLYKNRPWGEKLESYIENHITEKITLKDLGKQIDRSASFLSHYFKKEFGISAKQYILKKKMELAKNKLEKGNPVYIVASELNFYDEFHFSKSFKKYWGKSPKNFKP